MKSIEIKTRPIFGADGGSTIVAANAVASAFSSGSADPAKQLSRRPS